MGDKKILVGILTVSDSCSQGVAQDTSGDNLEIIVLETGKMLVEVRECVPDNRDMIKDVLIQWSDVIKLDLILTTGGTGFGNRDITPEATKEVIEKEANGISTAIMVESLKITPFAMLSRAVSGVRKNTFIINLPGSKKGSGECLNIVLECIPHVVSLLRDTTDDIKKEHSVIQGSSHSCSHHHKSNHHHHNHHGDESGKSQVDISRVARRPREMDRFPMLELNEAINIVLYNATLKETELVNLRNEESRQNIIGCVLAENIVAKEPFPPFPASIKDGYAVIASEGSGPRRVVGSTIAGSSPDVHPVGEKICVRINTGAPVPEGMDAVVQVEDTELLEEADDGRMEVSVNILIAPVIGQDIRPIGSDIAENEIILCKNRIITTTDLGLFATLGINEVRIFKSPRIGILSTGDELSKAWNEEDPKPGCIRDSNKITLFHLLKENGFTATDCGIARDNPDDVMKKMSEALEMVDVLITTGSVSMGERDLIKNILATDLGATIHFGRVNMKPGKPMTFATCKGQDSRDKLVFALPGNPSSAVVTCHVFVLPTLRKLKGVQNYKNQVVAVKLNEKIPLDFRPELKRAVLQLNQVSDLKNDLSENSIKEENCGLYEITASTTGNQISSRLASLQGANALLKLPPYSQEKTFIEAGSKVEAYVIGKLSYAQ